MSKQMFYTTLGNRFNNPKAMYVELTFDATPNFTKSITPLLYDKKFAFGIRLDDGCYKAFTNVFAVLYGGIPDEQNNFHAGIRSTDGCGNDVVWAGDFAMPTLGFGYHDDDQTSRIRWSTLKFARDFGFGVMYHGHENPSLNSIVFVDPEATPLVRKTDRDAVYADVIKDFQEANKLIQDNLNFTPLVATTPTGFDEIRSILLNDGVRWKAPFRDSGYWTIGSRVTSEIGGITKSPPLSPGLDINAIDNNWFLEGNFYPGYYHYTGATGWESLQQIKDSITEMHTTPGNFGKYFFTHDIQYEYTGGGMTIAEFKELMTWIDTNYGKTSGLDEVWFASVQSVLEYTWCRLNTTINEYREGNKIILEIIPPQTPVIGNTQRTMRRPALTFKINSDIPVKNINIHNIDKFSQKVLNLNSGIINVEWSSEHFAAAERLVTQLETTQSELDKLYALSLTNMISIPDKKNILLGRINDVELITQILWWFDFGFIGTGFSSDYPYNMIGNTTNNYTYTAPATFSNLIKSATGGTVMTLTVGTGFVSAMGSTKVPGDKTAAGRVINDGYFLDTALKDYFSVAQGSSAILTLSGLKDNKKYDFALHPNRAFVNSTTKYTIYNDISAPTFNQNVSKAGRTNTTLEGNFDDPALMTNAIPLNGILYIKVEGVSSAGYINAMKVTEHD